MTPDDALPDPATVLAELMAIERRAGGGMFFILDDATGVPVPTHALEWGLWLESHPTRRVVGSVMLGRVHVSTVFLGLDHQYRADGPPVLWETMIFGGFFDGLQRRYTSAAQARTWHARTVALVQTSRIGPRKLRKAFRKLGRNWSAPMTRKEARRVLRAVLRLEWLDR